MSFPWPPSLGSDLTRTLSRAVEPDPQRRNTAAQFRQGLEQVLKEPRPRKKQDKAGDYRVVLAYVPDQMMELTISMLQAELSMTEEEATITALSAPTTVLNSTSHNAAQGVESLLQAAGLGAKLVEVDEGYSRSLGQSSLRQYLVNRGEVKKLVSTRLSKDRRCHCYVCGHDWTAPRTRGRRPPAQCPQCHSNQWNLRRVLKCGVCGHEFAHGDHETPARQLFPACPACGTLEWLARDKPSLQIKRGKRNLGTVRLGQPKSVGITIRNRGKGALRGIIRSREPWLLANKSFSGETKMSIPIDTSLLRGEQRYQGVLHVLSNGGAQRIQVDFLAQTPERVRVSPASLDFGKVDAHPGLRTLKVSNSGGGQLQGSVSASVPWLKLSGGEIAGNSTKLAVVARPLEMPSGESVSASIHVATNGGQVTIPVQATAMPAKLALTPKSLEFKAIPPGEKRSRIIHLENLGAGVLAGRATLWPEWVKLSRTQWSGNAFELTAEVDGRHLADGVERKSTIHFSSNGGDLDLPIRATALGPTLALQPSAVYLGTVTAGSRKRFRLRVTNTGSGSLSGRARAAASWLRLDEESFSGRRANLRVRLETKGLAPGSYTGSIEIESNGGHTSVVVQMQITESAGARARLTRMLGRPEA